jgi:hypothetical protein
MSSTKRKSKGPAFDYYPTPGWCVTRLLEKVNLPTENMEWLEPCVGNCAIVDSVNEFYNSRQRPTPTWHAVEIQERFREDILERDIDFIIGDFFTIPKEMLGNPDVIITNPPFNHALEFIKSSLELQPQYVCMLLRLNFLGSGERSSFLRENMPDIYVLPNRPSFSGGGTDSIEYAWFVWSKENNYGLNQSGKTCILESTSKEERKRKKIISVSG